MAKGALGKQNVEDKIAKAFGNDFIGIYDKKLYVWADDGGEKVQIAISLTCPKTQVQTLDTPISGDLNFEDDAPKTLGISGYQPAEITKEEREKANELLELVKTMF